MNAILASLQWKLRRGLEHFAGFSLVVPIALFDADQRDYFALNNLFMGRDPSEADASLASLNARRAALGLATIRVNC